MPRSSKQPVYKPIATKPTPTSAVAIQPPLTPSNVQGPSFGQMVKEGLAFGSGQAIAHRVVSHMFGPSQQQQPQIQVPTEYIQCMKESKGDAEACKYLLG